MTGQIEHFVELPHQQIRILERDGEVGAESDDVAVGPAHLNHHLALEQLLPDELGQQRVGLPLDPGWLDQIDPEREALATDFPDKLVHLREALYLGGQVVPHFFNVFVEVTVLELVEDGKDDGARRGLAEVVVV